MNNLIPEERIEKKIFLIRGQKVMIDRDLAELYSVGTGYLKRQVKRNIDRFPEDFMFVLSGKEIDLLVCQIGIPSKSYFGGSKPYAFTEHGVLMLSSVLKSKTAIQINIKIMRIFVKLRQILSTHRELQRKLDILEERMEKRYSKHDEEIQLIFKVIRKLMSPLPEKPKRKIGFVVD